MKVKKIRLENVVLTVSIICMIYYSFIINFICTKFNYFDDLFAIIFILYAIILSFKKNKFSVFNNYEKRLLYLLIILIIIGITGNFISGFQNNWLSIIVDILSYLKFFGIFLASLIVFDDSDGNKEYNIFEILSKFVLIVNTIIFSFNIIFKWGLAIKYSRYGLIPYSLGGHPSYASAISCFCLSILLTDKKKNIWWIILGLFLTSMSLRMKALVYVVLIIVYLLFFEKKGTFSLKHLGIYFIISIILAHKYISGYFLDFTASRGAALIGSLKLAKYFFPIGSGFATFGSVQSINFYSKAYYFTGLNERFGFTKTHGAFSGDGGWATHIGQLGFIGVIILIALFVVLFLDIKKRVNNNSSYAPYISLLLYLLISSSSEIAFTSNYAVIFAIAMVIIIKKPIIKKKKMKG